MTQLYDDRSRPDIRVDSLVGRTLEEVEGALIVATLARTGGNRTWAADILGISLLTLRDKLLRFNGLRELADGPDTEEEAFLAQLQSFSLDGLLPS